MRELLEKHWTQEQANNRIDNDDDDIGTSVRPSDSGFSTSTATQIASTSSLAIPPKVPNAKTATADANSAKSTSKKLSRKQSISQRQKGSRRRLRSFKAQVIGEDDIKNVSKRRRNNAVPIFVEYDATSAPVVSTGWHGRRDDKSIQRRVYTTAEVAGMDDMTIIPWVDGYVYHNKRPTSVLSLCQRL